MQVGGVPGAALSPLCWYIVHSTVVSQREGLSPEHTWMIRIAWF